MLTVYQSRHNLTSAVIILTAWLDAILLNNSGAAWIDESVFIDGGVPVKSATLDITLVGYD